MNGIEETMDDLVRVSRTLGEYVSTLILEHHQREPDQMAQTAEHIARISRYIQNAANGLRIKLGKGDECLSST